MKTYNGQNPLLRLICNQRKLGSVRGEGAGAVNAATGEEKDEVNENDDELFAEQINEL